MSTTTEPVTNAAPGSAPPTPGTGRRDAAIALGLPLLLALVVFCLAYPPTNVEPDGLAVGLVVDQPEAIADQVTDQITEQLDDQGLEVHTYTDAEEARQAIRDREVYGALVLEAPEPTVMVASAASGQVAALLRQQATSLAAGMAAPTPGGSPDQPAPEPGSADAEDENGPGEEGVTEPDPAEAGGEAGESAPAGDEEPGLEPGQDDGTGREGGAGAAAPPAGPVQPVIEDVVPNPDGDPNGAAFGVAMLPFIAIGAAAGMVLARGASNRFALLGWVSAFALTGGVAMTLLLRTGLDALGGDFWTGAGILAVALFSVTSVAAGLARAIGAAGFGVLMAALITLGLPASGAQFPTELLAEPWRTVGPYLQPAAALDLLRGVVYFDGAATGHAATVLAAWSLLGLVLLLLFRGRR